MMKSRAVFAAGAVFLSAALAVSYFQMKEPAVKATEVLTWDCEYPEYQPKTIMIYCGDGGAYVDKISWAKWNQKGAEGTGLYYKNLCEPDCADGTIVHAPVNVYLSNLTPRKGKYYLRTLDITSQNGKDFPWGEAGNGLEWDVMDFAEQMNWDG
jgi:hypothetical protein